MAVWLIFIIYSNVDAHSGVLLNHFGMREFEYYTVVFAVSRALGCLANLVWSRAYGLPIERPGSITLRWIEDKFGDHKDVKWNHIYYNYDIQILAHISLIE